MCKVPDPAGDIDSNTAHSYMNYINNSDMSHFTHVISFKQPPVPLRKICDFLLSVTLK